MSFNLDEIVGGLVEKKNNIQTINNSVEKKYKKSRESDIKSEPDKNKQKILSNYDLISKKDWPNIPINTYIRYENKNGELKTGARLKAIRRQGNNLVLTLKKMTRGKPAITWSVNTSVVSFIYKLKKEKLFELKNPPDYKTTGNTTGNTPSNQTTGYQFGNPNPSSKQLRMLGESLLNEDITSVSAKVDIMEVKIQRIERDIQKLFTLIKRLYVNTT